jgi:UDP-glucose 4-epimerase
MKQDFRAETFELGRGRNYSINEIADLFGGDKRYLPSRKGEYDRTLCDYSKANDILGWSPVKNLNKYITKIKENNV